ncbi:progranulin-like [Silurus meridionalis]|uniref:progranulin-like n=1 Tax=Silurus meridionalis TaxID=175797 RepID=UPI001EEA3C8B|nr:progranulin-like [Silurus meridionalis]
MIAVLVLLLLRLVSGSIVCPDGTECDDKNTCCPANTGYACCHYPFAVCCPDKAHCCPQDYQCDQETGTCKKNGLHLYGIAHSRQIPAQKEEKITPVPLGKSDNPLVSCGNFYTCFKSLTLKRDQCCQCKAGCCPNGFHCNEKTKACVRDSDPSTLKKSTLNLQSRSGVIHCSDQFYCPDGNTCCKTPTSQWACCPYTLGQCCKDGLHCCEYGYDCNWTFTKCKKKRGYTIVPAGVTKEALLL